MTQHMHFISSGRWHNTWPSVQTVYPHAGANITAAVIIHILESKEQKYSTSELGRYTGTYTHVHLPETHLSMY